MSVGPRRPIKRIEENDLKENGGNYRLQAGPARPVDGATLADAQAGDRTLVGGAATPVYVVDESTWGHGLIGGTAEAVYEVTDSKAVRGHVAIPVYAVGDEWPDGGTPAVDVQLDWTDNSDDEDEFKIERKIDSGSFTQIATVGADVTTYTDDGLDAGHTYTYRVRASNAAGDSDYSNEDDVTV